MKGLNQVLIKLNRFPNLGRALAEERLREVADAVYKDSQVEVPVDTGALKASGKLERSDSENKITYTISYDTEYAAHVHELHKKYLIGPFDAHKGELKTKIEESLEKLL